MIVVAHRYVLLRKSNKFDQHGLSQENHNAQSQTIWVDPNPLGVISRSNHKFDFRFFDFWKSHRSFIRSLEHFHLESSAHLLYHPEKKWLTNIHGWVSGSCPTSHYASAKQLWSSLPLLSSCCKSSWQIQVYFESPKKRQSPKQNTRTRSCFKKEMMGNAECTYNKCL